MSDQMMRTWLAFFLGIAISFVLWGLFFIVIEPNNRETLNLILGALLAKLTDVYGYSFGASAEQTRLSTIVAKQADTANIIASAVPTPDTEPKQVEVTIGLPPSTPEEVKDDSSI